MNDIKLATKGYVDKLAARQFYYDGNIANTIPVSTIPMPYLANHECNICTIFDKSGFIYYIDFMLPSLVIPDFAEPVFAGLLKNGTLAVKVGDIKNKSDFIILSKKKYATGSYTNVEFTTRIIEPGQYESWPVGPDGGWTSWLDVGKESGPVCFWTETENEGVYVCVGKVSKQGEGFIEPLIQNPVKRINDHFQLRASNYAGVPLQFISRMCVQFDVETTGESELVTTAYVNSAFGLTGGSSDLATVEYVDEMDKLREVWPEEYYPYQPDLTLE